MESQSIIVVVGSGSNFNTKEIREMIIKQLNEENFPIETEILIEEKSILPEVIFESIEEIEANQKQIFKKISYQQQQKDLRFLNKRRKK